jgi:hypothetical protein
MAIKKVRAKSGQMYDANSSQGRTIVAAATTGKDADFDSSSSSLGADTSMTETLQLIYGETQESAESLDNIEAALVDEGRETAEERAARLEKSNKDKSTGNKFANAMGMAKDKISSGASKLKGSLSGKFGLALLGGGLVLLNKYGDEIAGPDGWLTKFLKYMKENLIPDIKALYEDLTVWWDSSWLKVKEFFTFIEDTFKKIGAYMDKFDTDGIPGLSEEEYTAMGADLLTKFKTAIMGLVTEIAVGIVSAIGLLTIGKLALSTILSPTVGAPIGAKAIAGRGLLGTAALTGLVVAGLWVLTDKVAEAYGDAITDEAGKKQDFDGKEFLARFFGGNDEGDWINSATMGMKGAVIGGAIGSIVPGVGTAIGVAVGALIGGIIGVTGGALGKTKIKSWLDNFTISFGEGLDSITNVFDGVVAAAAAAAPGGESPEDAFNKQVNVNQIANLKTKDDIQKKIAQVQNAMRTGEFLMVPGTSMANFQDQINDDAALTAYLTKLQDKLKTVDTKIALAPVNIALKEVKAQEAIVKVAEKEASLANMADEGLKYLKNISQTNPGYVSRLLYMKYFDAEMLAGRVPLTEPTWLKNSGGLDAVLAGEQQIVEKRIESTAALVPIAQSSLSATRERYDALLNSTPEALELKNKEANNKNFIQRFLFNRKMKKANMSLPMYDSIGDRSGGRTRGPTVITTNMGDTNQSTQIVPVGLSARNEFWVNYDAVSAAVNN